MINYPSFALLLYDATVTPLMVRQPYYVQQGVHYSMYSKSFDYFQSPLMSNYNETLKEISARTL